MKIHENSWNFSPGKTRKIYYPLLHGDSGQGMIQMASVMDMENNNLIIDQGYPNEYTVRPLYYEIWSTTGVNVSKTVIQ